MIIPRPTIPSHTMLCNDHKWNPRSWLKQWSDHTIPPNQRWPTHPTNEHFSSYWSLFFFHRQFIEICEVFPLSNVLITVCHWEKKEISEQGSKMILVLKRFFSSSSPYPFAWFPFAYPLPWASIPCSLTLPLPWSHWVFCYVKIFPSNIPTKNVHSSDYFPTVSLVPSGFSSSDEGLKVWRKREGLSGMERNIERLRYWSKWRWGRTQNKDPTRGKGGERDKAQGSAVCKGFWPRVRGYGTPP